MLVCEIHALNDGLFIFSDCHCAVVLRALTEVPHMKTLETSWVHELPW